MVPSQMDAQAPTRQLRHLKFVNNVVANVLSIVLNVFLIAVIQTQARKQLRHYRKVLLLSTIVDLLLASLGLLLQPTYFAPDGIFIIIMDGIIEPLPQPWTTIGAMLPLFVMYLLLTIVPVSFIYRYRLICKNTEPTSRVFVCLIGAAVAVSAGYTSVWTFHLWPREASSTTASPQLNFSKYLDNEHWYLPDGGIPPFSAAVYADMSHVAILSALIIAAVYAIVIPCSVLIMRTLHRNRASMSAKTRQLQGQISRVLFAQAFVPFATMVVPLLVDILSIYCGLYFADSGLVLMIITAWAPVVNPVVTFCVVGQYRQAAMAFMQRLTAIGSGSTSTTSDGKTFSFSGAVLPTPKTGLLMHRESLSTRLLGGSTSLGGSRRPSTLEITKAFIGTNRR